MLIAVLCCQSSVAATATDSGAPEDRSDDPALETVFQVAVGDTASDASWQSRKVPIPCAPASHAVAEFLLPMLASALERRARPGFLDCARKTEARDPALMLGVVQLSLEGKTIYIHVPVTDENGQTVAGASDKIVLCELTRSCSIQPGLSLCLHPPFNPSSTHVFSPDPLPLFPVRFCVSTSAHTRFN